MVVAQGFVCLVGCACDFALLVLFRAEGLDDETVDSLIGESYVCCEQLLTIVVDIVDSV